MRKIFIYIAILSISLIACDKKEEFVNDTSKVVDLAGEWYVQYDHPTLGKDPFNAGHVELLTFNTAADDGLTMWITDHESFWDYKVKVNVDLATMSFSGEGESIIEDNNIQVKIMNGGIFPDKVLMTSKVLADSIYFEVWFENLEDETSIKDDKLLVSGYRHTGFSEDDE